MTIHCVIGILLAGILWRMGGSSNYPKAFRGIGIPILFTALTFFKVASYFPMISWLFGSLVVVGTLIITWGVLTVSYGVTSPLGQLFAVISNSKIRDIIIRGICGVCWSLSYAPVILYKGNYWMFLTCLIPAILVPYIRVSSINKWNGWIEEFLMGCALALGLCINLI